MENTTKTGGLARRIGAVTGLVAFIGFVSAVSASATAPDPGALAGALATNAGGAYLDAIVDVLPLLIPFLAAMWALGFVWKKLAPKKGGIK